MNSILWEGDDIITINKWRESAIGYRYMHTAAATYYNKIFRMIKLPSLCINAAICTSLFADDRKEIIIAAGIASLLATILSSIDQFLDFHAKALDHTKIASEASHLLADIDAQMTLPVSRRMSIDGFLDKCSDMYENLLIQSSDLPSWSINQFKKHVHDHGVINRDDIWVSSKDKCVEKEELELNKCNQV